MLLFRACRGPISLPFPSRWTRPIQRSRMSSAVAPFLFCSSHRTQMCMEAIMRFAWMMFVVLLLQACSTPELSKQAAAVEVVTQMDRKDCMNLGPVFGKGGGSFGGSLIADQKLMEYASNDLRNNAAAKGANVVVAQPHQMAQTSGKHGGSTSTSTVTGVAYKCP